MPVMRVGIVPTLDDPMTEHLQKAAVVLTRSATDRTSLGRAVVGSLEQPANAYRMPTVSAVLLWGKSEAELTKLVERHPAAVMMVVTPRKPSSGGPLAKALEDVAETGVDVHVVPFTGSASAKAYDVGPGRAFGKVTDVTRPPQQQSAPTIPRTRKPAAPQAAPTMPRGREVVVAATTAPAMPARRAVEPTGDAPAMPARDAAPVEAKPAPAMPERRKVVPTGDAPPVPRSSAVPAAEPAAPAPPPPAPPPAEPAASTDTPDAGPPE